MLTTGDSGVSRLVSVRLSSASLSLSLLLSFTKHTCRFTPLCSLRGKHTQSDFWLEALEMSYREREITH